MISVCTFVNPEYKLGPQAQSEILTAPHSKFAAKSGQSKRGFNQEPFYQRLNILRFIFIIDKHTKFVI